MGLRGGKVGSIYIAAAVENFNYLTAHNPVMTSVPGARRAHKDAYTHAYLSLIAYYFLGRLKTNIV